MTVAVDLVPYSPHQHFQRVGERPECPICLETDRKVFLFRETFVAHESPENTYHYFHKSCLVKWLNMPNKETCPSCTKTFKLPSKNLSFSFLEQVDQMLQLTEKNATRGAYWGAWIWTFAQHFNNNTFHLRAVLDFVTLGVSSALYLASLGKLIGERGIIKKISKCGFLLMESFCFSYLMPKTSIPQVQKLFVNTLILLSPGSNPIYEAALPIGDELYRRSRLAIPYLISVVAYRALKMLHPI